MPAALASKEEIVERLFAVFRDHGFEGASLAHLSQATGLGRSSLYHYFPKGKEQMAEAVLARAQAVVEGEILQVAQAPESLKVRVRTIVAALEAMYSGGRTPCVLGQLAVAGIGPSARERLKSSFQQWVTAIAKLARDAGLTEVRAREFGEDWVARLQGALIVQAATGSTNAFDRSLKALRDLARNSP